MSNMFADILKKRNNIMAGIVEKLIDNVIHRISWKIYNIRDDRRIKKESSFSVRGNREVIICTNDNITEVVKAELKKEALFIAHTDIHEELEKLFNVKAIKNKKLREDSDGRINENAHAQQMFNLNHLDVSRVTNMGNAFFEVRRNKYFVIPTPRFYGEDVTPRPIRIDITGWDIADGAIDGCTFTRCDADVYFPRGTSPEVFARYKRSQELEEIHKDRNMYKYM